MKKIAAGFFAALFIVVGWGAVYAQHDAPQSKPPCAIDVDKSVQLVPIYGWDIEAMYEEIVFYLPVPIEGDLHAPWWLRDEPESKQYLDSATIAGKLQALCIGMSRFLFRGLPIVVVSVEEGEHGLTATIDLRESPNAERESYRGASWRTGYFQGSTGGGFTQNTLVRTLLQQEYDGEWIDALIFHYDSEPIPEDIWDHHNLHKTFQRDTYTPSSWMESPH